MEFRDIIIIGLLTLAIITNYFSWNKVASCPACKECGSDLPKATVLDLQFSKENFPSSIYDNLFTGANPYLGGYKLSDSSKTSISQQTGISAPPIQKNANGFLKSG